MSKTPDLQEFQVRTELEELRRANTDLEMRLKRAKAKTDALVQAAFDGARQASITLGPVKAVPAPRVRHSKVRGRPEVALWVLTDWQLAKTTTSYDSDIARKRVLGFCDKAQTLTDIHRLDHPIRDCCVLFGGDIAEGLFNFPAQPFEIDASIFTQFVRGGQLVADVVRRALADHDRVTVISEYGNHGRIGSKRAAVPGADNFDRMIYELARAKLEQETRLKWADSIEDIRHVEIGNYRALLIHGDEVGRTGFASRNTIVNHVNKWRGGGHAWPFRDCYVGHYHVHGEDSLADGAGAVYWTGSPESDNRYAGIRHASASKPSQRLHFIDPREGRVTAQYRVWLPE